MSTLPSPFTDHAEPVLRGDPALTDEHRVALWDVFHQSKNPDELTQKLQAVPVPDDTKNRLVQAKHLSMPAVSPTDKVTAALTAMSRLDPSLLELAESHPKTASM